MALESVVYKAAETGVYQEIVDRFLYPYWEIIAGADPDGKEKALPRPDEFERMAKELVASRDAESGPQFRLPSANGGKLVRINEIRAVATKPAGSSGAAFVGALGAIDEIPDTDKVHKIASAVDRGVVKGSSWWNVFVADPLGMIGDLIVGVLTGTLRKRMGERFARSASTAVQEELCDLKTQPGMEKLLTGERITAIGERVAQEGRALAASRGNSSEPAGIRLKNDIKPLKGKEFFKPIIESALRTEVSEAFTQQTGPGGKSARELLVGGERSVWTLGLIRHGALDGHGAQAVEKRAADAFVKVVTDDAYQFGGKPTYELSDAELKAALIAEVGANLHKLHQELGWSYADQRVNAISQALQARLTGDAIDKMRKASGLAHGQTLSSMMPPQAKEMAERERAVGRAHGLSDPRDACLSLLPPCRTMAAVPLGLRRSPK